MYGNIWSDYYVNRFWFGSLFHLKKPETISDAKACVDCQTDWKKDIMVHAVQKEYQNIKYLTWANEDGTTHVLSKDYSFLHVWNNAEVQIGKQSGTAGLRASRENIGGEKTQDLIKKDLLDDQKEPLPSTSGEIYEDISKKPKAREMDVTDFAETSMRAEIKIECKFIKIIEDEVFDFLGTKEAPVPNPNHVGMYVKLIRDVMENNKK